METILVIDDEKNIQTTIAEVLESNELRVIGAGTGEQGLRLLVDAENVMPHGAAFTIELPVPACDIR